MRVFLSRQKTSHQSLPVYTVNIQYNTFLNRHKLFKN
jgi:hypothetical protein